MIFIVQNETVISNANPEPINNESWMKQTKTASLQNRGHISRFKTRICELKTFEEVFLR